MDHTRDNPLKRFTAFWIAFLLVATFGIGCIILRPLTHGEVSTAEQAAAEGRLQIKAEVLEAEAETLNLSALEAALTSHAKDLTNSQAPEPGSMAVPSAVPAPAPAEDPATAEDPAPADAPATSEEAAPAETSSETTN